MRRGLSATTHQSRQMWVARAFWAAVSLRPKRGGLGRALRRFTFTSSAALPRITTKSTSSCFALMAVRVKATLSAGHSSSPKKELVYSTVSPGLMPALAALPPGATNCRVVRGGDTG